ncbi:hypothetical protein OIE66_21545 [Nonomuraea sp. NBC_01738]|uniref:hypothetical protein n=1 Tax=Nonomuraea sp. NBC_01738 TaxID=2976003 RepID=UPI002E0EC220|nr:hypothetical protein OIE66_21545 [Nonomuraea sp. NBC_01738]
MTSEDPLRRRGAKVAELATAIGSARPLLTEASATLRDLLDPPGWREYTGPGGELVLHEDFRDFVSDDPPRGLGTSLPVVRALSLGDAGLSSLVDRALHFTGEDGDDGDAAGDDLDYAEPPALSVTAQIEPREQEAPERPAAPKPPSPAQQAALRKLSEEAPALHTRVLAGEMSTHAAMVEAGLRTRMISVPVSRPESAAKALRKNLSKPELTQLIELLSQDL